MTEAGLMSGYTDGAFRPNQSITRQEIATIAVRIKHLQDIGAGSFPEHFSRMIY